MFSNDHGNATKQLIQATNLPRIRHQVLIHQPHTDPRLGCIAQRSIVAQVGLDRNSNLIPALALPAI